LKAQIKASELVIEIDRPYTTENGTNDAAQVKQEFDAILGEISQYLAWVSNDLAGLSDLIRSKALERIGQRKKKILSDRGVAEAVGFPLKRREGIPETYIAPLSRKKIPLPLSNPTPFEPEPTLTMEHYEFILKVMGNMAVVMERDPASFRNI